MALIKQTEIEVGTIVRIIEQQIAAGEDFTGDAPALGVEPFTPYLNDADGRIVMAQHDNSAVVEGDAGGLFEVTADGPYALEYVMADFGSSIAWTLAIATDAGDCVIDSGTSRYLTRVEHDRLYLLPSDKVKITTTAGTAAMWARVGLTLAQGTH